MNSNKDTATNVVYRQAQDGDIPAIVAMLADDELGRAREDPGNLGIYSRAFDRMKAEANNRLFVAEQKGRVVGCFQITFIQGLSRKGVRRALIEGVRTRSDARGHGIGEGMMRHAIVLARENGCGIAQLTSDKTRVRAHEFYKRLGFVQSSEGFKLNL